MNAATDDEEEEEEEIDEEETRDLVADLLHHTEEEEEEDEERMARSAEIWSYVELLTANASQRLCEQLRLILEPTMATKLKGDFRTGKRINMRKIIPYIASSYRKDKIWLRRKKPSKREYQIMIAIDDSLSMQNKTNTAATASKSSSSSSSSSSDGSNGGSNGAGTSATAGSVALEALSLIGNALTRLEVGEMSVVSFGEETPRTLHEFGSQFTSDSGVSITSGFTFTQQTTDMVTSVQWMLHKLNAARESSSNENAQLVFVITDALGCTPQSLMKLKKMTRSAKNCLFVLIIIDTGKNSILDINRVAFDGPKR
jgi:midasin